MEYKGGIVVFQRNKDWWIRTSWAGQYMYVIGHLCPQQSGEGGAHHTYWVDHEEQTCWGCHNEIPSELIAMLLFLDNDASRLRGRSLKGDECYKCKCANES